MEGNFETPQTFLESIYKTIVEENSEDWIAFSFTPLLQCTVSKGAGRKEGLMKIFNQMNSRGLWGFARSDGVSENNFSLVKFFGCETQDGEIEEMKLVESQVVQFLHDMVTKDSGRLDYTFVDGRADSASSVMGDLSETQPNAWLNHMSNECFQPSQLGYSELNFDEEDLRSRVSITFKVRKGDETRRIPFPSSNTCLEDFKNQIYRRFSIMSQYETNAELYHISRDGISTLLTSEEVFRNIVNGSLINCSLEGILHGVEIVDIRMKSSSPSLQANGLEEQSRSLAASHLAESIESFKWSWSRSSSEIENDSEGSCSEGVVFVDESMANISIDQFDDGKIEEGTTSKKVLCETVIGSELADVHCAKSNISDEDDIAILILSAIPLEERTDDNPSLGEDFLQNVGVMAAPMSGPTSEQTHFGCNQLSNPAIVKQDSVDTDHLENFHDIEVKDSASVEEELEGSEKQREAGTCFGDCGGDDVDDDDDEESSDFEVRNDSLEGDIGSVDDNEIVIDGLKEDFKKTQERIIPNNQEFNSLGQPEIQDISPPANPAISISTLHPPSNVVRVPALLDSHEKRQIEEKLSPKEKLLGVVVLIVFFFFQFGFRSTDVQVVLVSTDNRLVEDLKHAICGVSLNASVCKIQQAAGPSMDVTDLHGFLGSLDGDCANRVRCRGQRGCAVIIAERATIQRFGERNPVTGYLQHATGRLFLESSNFKRMINGRIEKEETVMLLDGSCKDWGQLVDLKEGQSSSSVVEKCNLGMLSGRRELFRRFVGDKICRKTVFSSKARFYDINSTPLPDFVRNITFHKKLAVESVSCSELEEEVNEMRSRSDAEKVRVAVLLAELKVERARAQKEKARLQMKQKMLLDANVASSIQHLREDLDLTAEAALADEGLFCAPHVETEKRGWSPLLKPFQEPTKQCLAAQRRDGVKCKPAARFGKFHFMVFGEVGSGKSTTLHWLCRHAGLADTRCRAFQYSHGAQGADHTHTRNLRGLDVRGTRVFDTAGNDPFLMSKIDQLSSRCSLETGRGWPSFAFGVKLLASGYQKENFEIHYPLAPEEEEWMGMKIPGRIGDANFQLHSSPVPSATSHAVLLIIKYQDYTPKEFARLRSFLDELERTESDGQIVRWRSGSEAMSPVRESAETAAAAGQAMAEAAMGVHLPGWISSRREWVVNGTREAFTAHPWEERCRHPAMERGCRPIIAVTHLQNCKSREGKGSASSGGRGAEAKWRLDRERCLSRLAVDLGHSRQDIFPLELSGREECLRHARYFARADGAHRPEELCHDEDGLLNFVSADQYVDIMSALKARAMEFYGRVCTRKT